jgi:uncharacterized membrane protein
MNEPTKSGRRWPPIAAAFVALFGVGDTAYLTYHHYTAIPVPCSVLSGCEQVLNSQWATLAGFLPESLDYPLLATIPLAGLGLAAYLLALALAALSIAGNRTAWLFFGIHAVFMAGFSGLLFYIQAFRIEAFCQYCLLSAASSLTLLIIALISRFWRD